MHMLYDSESFVVVHMLPDAVERAQGAQQDTAPPFPSLHATASRSWTNAPARRFTWTAPGPRCFPEQILATGQRDTDPGRKSGRCPGPLRGPAQRPRWWCTDATSRPRVIEPL